MLTRLGIVAALALMVGVLWCAPAMADDWWGTVQCGNAVAQPGCDLTAGHNSAPGSRPQPLQNPKPNSTNPGQTTDGLDTVEDKDPTIHCSYVRSDYRPPIVTAPSLPPGPPLVAQPAAFIRPTSARMTPRAVVDPDPGQHGAWYVYKCDGPGTHDATYRPPIWIPDGQQPAAALPSPLELAQQARSQLRLPSAQVISNPSGVQIVGVPTWLWLPASSWGTRSSTAAVPGLAVTATATTTTVTWILGDGSTLTCHGPGTPYQAGNNPAASSPDCGHTYHQPSVSQPGGVFAASATVHWAITWAGGGQSGTLPELTTTASTGLRVTEVQALNTVPG